MIERTRFREALPRDASDQAEVFHHAVMEGASSHYSLAEREAWAAALPRTAEAWGARQTLYTTLVAECDGHCIAFCEHDAEARIETLYVWPSVARQGIGSRLLQLTLDRLAHQGHTQASIEASLMLAPALQAGGWERLGEEQVERHGVMLSRVRLQIALPEIDSPT